MAIVTAYNTDGAQFSSQEKNYYHTDDACPFGRKISAVDKVAGVGSSKDACPLCIKPNVR